MQVIGVSFQVHLLVVQQINDQCICVQRSMVSIFRGPTWPAFLALIFVKIGHSAVEGKANETLE